MPCYGWNGHSRRLRNVSRPRADRSIGLFAVPASGGDIATGSESGQSSTAADTDGLIDRWSDLEWRRSVLDWAETAIAEHFRTAAYTARQVQARPWGTVFRLSSGGRTFWLKAYDDSGAIEAAAMQWLHGRFPSAIPAIVAISDRLSCLLLADAGRPLGEAWSPVPLWAWQAVLLQYGALQRGVEGNAEELVAYGIPFYPPADVPAMLQSMLEDTELLLVGDPRGLSVDEHRLLASSVERFTRAAAELDSAGVPLTVQHDDLSEANVCGDVQTVRFIDWADLHVGHPFASLIFPMRYVEEHHGVGRDDPEYLQVVRPYFGHWAESFDLGTLLRLSQLAAIVGIVTKAESWSRALSGLTRSGMNDYYASPEARWLRKLLTTDVASRARSG